MRDLCCLGEGIKVIDLIVYHRSKIKLFSPAFNKANLTFVIQEIY